MSFRSSVTSLSVWYTVLGYGTLAEEATWRKSQMSQAGEYLAAHNVEGAISAAVARVVKERPADPVAAIGKLLCEATDTAYAEAVRYIFSNADFSGSAKRYQNPQENWERFERLLELLGQPYKKLKVAHVAGTNGKGTTSALCDAMLRASDSGSVGLFTSPHLHSFRERIRVNGALVSKAAIVSALAIVKPAVETLGYASPFEKLTALALVCFTSAGCTWAVMETGLGGRWDCTNHCTPLVCGVTRIGLDHMNVLGSTIAAIAGEKAGILKAAVPAFCVPQHPEAMPVLEAAAAKCGAPLQLAERPDPAEGGAVGDGDDALPFWLTPRHQQHNAAMAEAMLSSLLAEGHLEGFAGEGGGRAKAEASWRTARDHLSWPCRFELLEPSALRDSALPRLILDVAHNEPAMEALLASVGAAWPSAACAVIFGANFDKDVSKIVSLIAAMPQLALSIAVQSSHPKAVPTSQIIDECAKAAPESVGRWRAAKSMVDALHLAAGTLPAPSQGSPSGLVVCCGSVFVAADMRAALAELEPSLFAAGDWVFEQRNEPHLLM